MAKETDPNHPTINAVAGFSAPKAKGVAEHCPDLDIIGINTYGGLHGLRADLEKRQWAKPWIVTEFGPAGYWERPKTSWGRPIEQTSTEKAETLRKGYEKIAKSDQRQSLTVSIYPRPRKRLCARPEFPEAIDCLFSPTMAKAMGRPRTCHFAWIANDCQLQAGLFAPALRIWSKVPSMSCLPCSPML